MAHARIVNGARSGLLAGFWDFYLRSSGRGNEARLPGTNMARFFLAKQQAVSSAKGLLASATTRVLPSCGRTVGSVLSRTVGSYTGPISDLGQIPRLSKGSAGTSIARETIFVVVASACCSEPVTAHRSANSLGRLALVCIPNITRVADGSTSSSIP
jgi:hypothetical protein